MTLLYLADDGDHSDLWTPAANFATSSLLHCNLRVRQWVPMCATGELRPG